MLKLVEEPHAPQAEGMDPRVALGITGVLVAKHPNRVLDLLERYGVSFPEKPNKEAIIEQVVELSTATSPDFRLDISKMIVAMVDEASQYDNFNLGSLGSLFGKGGGDASTAAAGAASEGGAQAAASSGGGGSIAADPVSAVATGLGKIADVFGKFREKANIKERAKATMQAGMFQYMNLKEETKALATKKNTYIALGMVAVVALGIFLLRPSSPPPAPINNLA